MLMLQDGGDRSSPPPDTDPGDGGSPLGRLLVTMGRQLAETVTLLDHTVKMLEDTRRWVAELEESHGALEHRVAIHHSAFAVGALEPPADLDERSPKD